MPACNRARGHKARDAGQLARLAIDSLRLGSHIKVLSDRLQRLDPGKESRRPVTMTEAQQKILAACGITPDGRYSPPAEEAEESDVLQIRTFEIKVAKSSSVSMKDFELMLKSGKKLNKVGELMKAGWDDFEQNGPRTDTAAIEWLRGRIDFLGGIKRRADAEINSRRYTLALGGYGKEISKETPVVEEWEVSFEFRDDVERRI